MEDCLALSVGDVDIKLGAPVQGMFWSDAGKSLVSNTSSSPVSADKWYSAVRDEEDCIRTQ